jgi:predicted dehydrogenase
MLNENKVRILLIGYGYWGKNLLRNLLDILPPEQVEVAEISSDKLQYLSSIYPGVLLYSSASEALLKSDASAVIIATSTKSHYFLAKQALQLGKHVLVEKPLTTSIVEAKELTEIAASQKLILMVDHVFLYHPVLKKMKEYFQNNELGKINYIDSTRVNLGIYQQEINVIWDLACHDISIINFLLEENPIKVRAIGRINTDFGVEDVAYLFLYYSSGLLVQINSSWASPVKMRKMVVGGERKMLIYDDIEPTNKLTIFEYEQNTRYDENKTKLTDYRLGNITIPKYEPTEALRNVLNEFVHCIVSKSQPLANGESALPVINILEKAQLSLSLNGAIIPLA